MAMTFGFEHAVDDSVKTEFENHSSANIGRNYEIKNGDLVQLKSLKSGATRIFIVRQRVFSFLPDEKGDGLIILVLGEPLPDELLL
ncbi:hypothetical protein ACUN7Z_00465 [Vreelandella venusta]|uniref:hypothetical protein n=1 Tax=Vreelandella venusta TaxID=44935 RepID=UPI004044B742